MNENKKTLLGLYLTFLGIAGYCFSVGYFFGKAKKEIRTRLFAFAVPETFDSDDIQYYLNEALEILRSRNFEVTDKELKQIASEACMRTEASKSLVEGLFNTGES